MEKKKIKDLSLRLNEEDYILLKIKAEESNLTKNAFLRKIIKLSYVEDIKDFNSNLKDLFILYKSISNNLNQLARAGHDIKNFKEIEKELKQLWQSLVE